jgi:hypothetical protein
MENRFLSLIIKINPKEIIIKKIPWVQFLFAQRRDRNKSNRMNRIKLWQKTLSITKIMFIFPRQRRQYIIGILLHTIIAVYKTIISENNLRSGL